MKIILYSHISFILYYAAIATLTEQKRTMTPTYTSPESLRDPNNGIVFLITGNASKIRDSSVKIYSDYFKDFNDTVHLIPISTTPVDENSAQEIVMNIAGNSNSDLNVFSDTTGQTFFSIFDVFSIGDKNTQLISNMNFFVNYTSDTPMLSNFPYPIYQANISLSTSNAKNEQSFSPTFLNFMTKVDYSNITVSNSLTRYKKVDSLYLSQGKLNKDINIGLTDDNKLYLMSIDEKTGTLKGENIKNYISPPSSAFGLMNINNFWITHKESSELMSDMLIVLGNHNDLLYYNISLLENGAVNFYLHSYFDVPSAVPVGNSSNHYTVVKAEIWKDFTVVAIEEVGLLIFKYSKADRLSWSYYKGFSSFFTRDGSSKFFSAIDFVINRASIYVLIKNFGLKILIIDQLDGVFKYSLDENFEFYHPYLASLKKVNDSSIPYIEVYVNNTEKDSAAIPEIMFELNILDERNPLVCKIISSHGEYTFSNIISTDSYLFFFDHSSSSLAMLRKNLNSHTLSRTYLYRLDLSTLLRNNNTNQRYSLFQVFYKGRFGIMFNSLSLLYDARNLVVHKFIPGGNMIRCRFNHEGIYKLQLYYVSPDPRHVSLDRPSMKIVYFEISDSNKYIWIVVGIVGGLLVISVIVVLIIKLRKKKKNVHSSMVQESPAKEKEIIYEMTAPKDPGHVIPSKHRYSSNFDNVNTNVVTADAEKEI